MKPFFHIFQNIPPGSQSPVSLAPPCNDRFSLCPLDPAIAALSSPALILARGQSSLPTRQTTRSTSTIRSGPPSSKRVGGSQILLSNSKRPNVNPAPWVVLNRRSLWLVEFAHPK